MFSLLFGSLLSTAEAVPLQLSQQGRLVDSSGTAATGNHSLTFRLYNASTGGTLLWSETVSTSFTNGYYSVVLGSDTINNPLQDSVLESGQLYVELEIDSAGPLSPRSTVTSTPFARVAGRAEVAESADWSGLTSVPNGLNDGDDDTVGSLSCSEGEQAVFTNGAWSCGNPVADVNADSRLAALEALVTSLQTDLATTQSSLATTQASLTTTQSELATTQSDLATANSTITTLESALSTAQTDIGLNTTEIAALDTDLTTAEGNITTLQGEMATAQADISTLQSDVTDLQSNVLDLIDVDTTWTIGTSGDYAGLVDAMAAARSVRIHPDATLTLQLANDIYTVSEEINLNHPDGANIVIQGNSSDPALVQLEFASSNGFYIDNGHVFGGINALTARGTSSYDGMLMINESLVHMDTVVFEEWNKAIRGKGGTNLYLEGDCYFENNVGGVYLDYNATIRHDPSAGTLYVQNNSSSGITLYYGSTAMLHQSVFSSNGSQGLTAYMGSSAYAVNSTASSNVHNGINSGWGSAIDVGGATFNSNGHSGVVTHAGGVVAIGNSSADSNGWHGYRASNHGFFYGDYMTASNSPIGFLIERISHGRTAYSTISNNTQGIVTKNNSFVGTHLETFSGNGTNKVLETGSVEE